MCWGYAFWLKRYSGPSNELQIDGAVETRLVELHLFGESKPEFVFSVVRLRCMHQVLQRPAFLISGLIGVVAEVAADRVLVGRHRLRIPSDVAQL